MSVSNNEIEVPDLILRNEHEKTIELIAKGLIPTNAKSVGPLSEQEIINSLEKNKFDFSFKFSAKSNSTEDIQEYNNLKNIEKEKYMIYIKKALSTFYKHYMITNYPRLSNSKIIEPKLLVTFTGQLSTNSFMNLEDINDSKIVFDTFKLKYYIDSKLLNSLINYSETKILGSDDPEEVQGKLLDAFSYFWNQLNKTLIFLGTDNTIKLYPTYENFYTLTTNDINDSKSNNDIFYDNLIKNIESNFEFWFNSKCDINCSVSFKYVTKEYNVVANGYDPFVTFQIGSNFDPGSN